MVDRDVNGHVDFLDDWVGHRHVNLFHVVYRYGHVNLLDVVDRDVDLLHVMVVYRMHVVRNVNDVVFTKNKFIAIIFHSMTHDV